MAHKTHSLNYLFSPTCRFFDGYKPCPVARSTNEACPGKNCRPLEKKLVIFEMGGLGSILRITVVTKEFKRLFPESHITLVTHKDGLEILQRSPSIDRSLEFNFDTFLLLQVERFDYLYNFEVKPSVAALATLIKAKKKYGFGLNYLGKPNIFHKTSADLFRFQIEDKFRATNTKSIQQLLLESCGLKWQEQTLDIVLQEKDKQYAQNFWSKSRLNGKTVVGLNIGSRKKHALKRWPIDKFILLAKKLKVELEVELIILGGPEEKTIYTYTMKHLGPLEIKGNDCANTIPEFLAILDQCQVVVSATTFALIAATGLQCKTIAICSPKPVNEIYLYGKGIKITSSNTYNPLLYSTKIADLTEKEELKIGLKNIPVSAVYQAVKDVIDSEFVPLEKFTV